jgi:hypothetical protein
VLQEQIIPSKADARKWAMHLEATGLEDETTQSKQSKAEILPTSWAITDPIACPQSRANPKSYLV